MPLDNVGNFARDATTAAVDSTQTTIPVNNASVFPDPAVANYNVVIWDSAQYPRPDQDPNVEIMRVTARDTGTNDLTVTRGQEGTTGASHPSGSSVINAFTAAFADDIAATDANVESFSTAGATGTVPTSQGDGTLAMESAGDDLEWIELADSPITQSTVASVTLTLTDTYREVWLQVENWEGSFSTSDLEIRINGDTGTNYTTHFNDGTRQTSTSAFKCTVGSGANIDHAGWIRIDGAWNTNSGVNIHLSGSNPTNFGVSGINGSVTSPLNSITFRAGGNDIDISLHAYGVK